MEARTALWFLIFSGLAVNYMLRLNINIAIRTMARKGHNFENIPKYNYYSKNQTNFTKINDEYQWNEYEQNLVLGSFFWLNWVSTLPGGILAHYYGTKMIFGLSNFMSALACFTIPVVSKIDYRLTIVIRIVQGFFAGLAWPSMHYMVSQWSTPSTRGKFVSAYISGSSTGAAITFPLCGLIINYMSWEYVFYVTGFLSMVWAIGWYFLAFDTPRSHPFISSDELQRIEKNQKISFSSEKMKVPWKDILTSPQVFICSFAQWGVLWGVYTLSTQTPTYLESIHHMSVKMTGIILGIAQVKKVIFAFGFGAFTDYLLHKEWMSLIYIRKLSTCVCTIVAGISILILVPFGSNTIVATVLIVIANCSQAASSSGQIASFVDMSPNFASICATIGTICGMVSPLIVGTLTLHNQTEEQWKKVFLISGSVMCFPGIIYLLFGRSELQTWNNSNATQEHEDIEQQAPLKTN